MKSFCSKCLIPTNQKVVEEKVLKYIEEETTWWEKTNYQIIQCMGCDTISFRQLYNDASQQQYKGDTDATTQELYPKRGIHSRNMKAYRNVPVDIKRIYLETIEAYNNNLSLLCGVGIRAIIEGICNDKGIKFGVFKDAAGKEIRSEGLNGKIYGLASNGYLTSANAEVLHELRFLGNKAVHELTNPSIDDLHIAIDIIELVLDNIYELKHKAKGLMRKRKSQG